MYRSILALVSDAEGAERVMGRARALASRHEAVLHVAEEGAVPGGGAWAGAGSGGGADRVHAVPPGDIAALEELVHAVRADLLVAGSLAMRGGTDLPAGVPVLVTSTAAVQEGYGHVVVVLEGDQPAEAVVPYATTLAPRADMLFTLLAVVRPGYVIGGDSDVQVDLEGAARARGDAEARVEALAERLRRRGVEARGRVVTRTRQAAAVLELVEEGADLVAACCSGPASHGVGPALVGSGVDVLLYRSRERPLRRWAAGVGAREAG